MSSGRQAILCLEPHIDGPRHSGGFFYNDCLAATAAVTNGSRFITQAWDGGLLPSAFILLDSLWWYVHKRPLDFLSAALAGRSWGIIMHGLPDEASGLLGDMAEASFVVVPSFWAAGRLQTLRCSGAIGGQLDVRVLYPGWDGRPCLVLDAGFSGDSPPVRIASTSNWTRAKGLVEAACVLGTLSQDPTFPSWLWQAAGTPDPVLIAEAHSGLGPLASRLEPLGHLDPAALIKLLHGADIFLHPSGQETFCLSVFEAALAGCRVVARAIGGVPEAIHLAQLLRGQIGLPPGGVHLAPAVEHPGSKGAYPAPWGLHPGKETDMLCLSLEEAVLAAAALSATGLPVKSREEPEHPALDTTSTYQKNPIIPRETGKSRTVWNPASTAFHRGLLHEFSWHGRLEKLLLGQSDRPLPAIIQAQQGGAT